MAVGVRLNKPKIGEYKFRRKKRPSTECLRVVEGKRFLVRLSWGKLMSVIGRSRPAFQIPSFCVIPKNPLACNASYTLARRGRYRGMSSLLLGDEVGELKPLECQLLLIRRVRRPLECCTACSDQPRHACHVADHDRGRDCSVEEARGRGILCRRCLA